jgi:preprotein translocase subunit YajC
MNLLAIVIQGGATPRLLPNILMIGSFIAIFYFLILRPQKKLQTSHREMIDALKKGDEVMTEGGVIGQVVHIADERVTIKSAESRLVVARTKIARVFTTDVATEVK